MPRQGSYLDSETLSTVVYSIPEFAVIDTVKLNRSSETIEITLQMHAAIPSIVQRQRMVVEVWFQSVHSSESISFDRAFIYVAGGIEYPSIPALGTDHAAIIDWNGEEFHLRAEAAVAVRHNRISAAIPSEWLNEYRPLMAVVRYLPVSHRLDRVGGGFGSCISSFYLLNDDLIGYSMPLPPYVDQAYDSRISPPPSFQGGRSIRIPDSVPPKKRWPRRGDLDNDGDRDFELDVDMPVDGPVIIDVWITDDGGSSAYVIVIGWDMNGNGRLEFEEIWYPIGECPHVPGVNYGYIGGDGKIYWISYRDDNRNGRLDNGERKVTFVYIPWTGELVVIVDSDGTGSKKPTEVYRGDPNGYPWWHR
jgi:hypothetical protein